MYDSSLKQITFFREYHPELMPFIGEKYDDFKILHVGESHFIPQNENEKDIFPIAYFENWWTNPCNDMKEFSNINSDGYEWGGWLDTRNVVVNYLAGKRTRSHGIFTEMVKVFAQVYQNRTIPSITTEESQNYQYFAFMNFFQMPALYKGMKYWNSLTRSANKSITIKEQAKEYAVEVWNRTVKESSDILDQVIEVLHPNTIIFTSQSAWNAYKGKYKDSPRIITTVHPGCKFWNDPKENQTGKKQLVEKWAKMLRDNGTVH